MDNSDLQIHPTTPVEPDLRRDSIALRPVSRTGALHRPEVTLSQMLDFVSCRRFQANVSVLSLVFAHQS